MKKSVKVYIAAAIVLLMVLPVFAQSYRGGDIPTPTLLSPAEKADITGKDVLKFKWSSATMDIDRLQFRIYKGGIGSADLVFSQDVSGFGSYLEVKSDLFQDGEVYTWQLRAISDEGYKSDWAFDSFRVVKK